MSAGGVLGLGQLAPTDLAAQKLPGAGSTHEHNVEAANQFEAMMMAYMFQSMRQTVSASGLFGDDKIARSTYEYLLDQAVTTQALKAGKGYGLSQRLASQWDGKAGKSSPVQDQDLT